MNLSRLNSPSFSIKHLRQGMTDGQTRPPGHGRTWIWITCNLEWRWTSARLGFTKWNEMAPNRKRGGVFYKWYGKNNKLDSSQSRASAHKRKGTHFPCTFWPFWVRRECFQNGIWKDNLKRILNIRSWQLGITNLYCEVILATVFFILRLT